MGSLGLSKQRLQILLIILNRLIIIIQSRRVYSIQTSLEKIRNIEIIVEKILEKNDDVLPLDDLSPYWKEVLQKKQWINTKTLILSNCEINNLSISTVINLPWPNLTQLYLTENNINKGAKLLCKANMPQLILINLDGWNLKAEAVVFFAKAYWPKLQSISVQGSNIGLDGLQTVHKFNSKNLVSAWLNGESKIGNLSLLSITHWGEFRPDSIILFQTKKNLINRRILEIASNKENDATL